MQDNHAWVIAGDPHATEKQWMAACTIVDGKKHPSVVSTRQLPGYIGLPWSLLLSAVGGIGGMALYGLLTSVAYDGMAALMSYHMAGIWGNILSGLLVTVLVSGFATFSHLFAYQKHVWNGGRSWSLFHWSVVGIGAVWPCVFAFILNNTGALTMLDLIEPLLCSAGLLLVSFASGKLTTSSIRALESSVGARRVMPYSRTIFVGFGAFVLSCICIPGMAFILAQINSWWVPIFLIGSGLWIATANSARNPHTASVLALSAWSPLSVANAAIIPVLLFYCAFAPEFQLVDVLLSVLIGLSSIACLALGPVIGARIGSRILQNQAEKELHRIPLDACFGQAALLEECPAMDKSVNSLTEEAV